MWLEHFQDKWAKPGKNDTINLRAKYWQTRADDQLLLVFLVKSWFLIRIRSQSDCLIRKCLLQKIVGLRPVLVFNVHAARWRLVWCRQCCVNPTLPYLFMSFYLRCFVYILGSFCLTSFYFIIVLLALPSRKSNINIIIEWDDCLKKSIKNQDETQRLFTLVGRKM